MTFEGTQGMGDGFRSRIRSGELLFGTVLSVPSVALAELVAAPLDFVWIDLEHGALSERDVQSLAIGVRAAGSAALVRLPGHSAERLTAILDAGVDGIVAPRIDAAVEAEQLVQQLRYPPHGSRGSAARRAVDYGRAPGAAVVTGSEVAFVTQIETAAAVDAAAEIAAVDGVDALVVGCADLSLSLGSASDRGSEPMAAAIAHVEQAAAEAGVASGIAGPAEPWLLVELTGESTSIFVQSADVRMYARAVDDGVAELRRLLALRAPDEEGSHVGN